MNHQQRLAMPSSHLEMPDLDLSKLDEREKIFVLNYITNGFNGAAAAKASLYPAGSAKVRASEMLKKPAVKEAIALVMNARCKVLGVDANWVLEQAVTLFERCMQTEKVIDQYGATGEYKFDANNAIKALHLIGKHVDVRAFESDVINVNVDEQVINRLQQARQRVAALPEPSATEPLPVIEEAIIEPETEEEPPVTFLVPPKHSPELVTDASEPDAMLSDAEKLEQLMEHWRKDTSLR
ncbi:terminase small subunit [Vibrio mediterranei]|uniref:terminase small subunit n=1 Tax=Vibrio mediterranei TaxID=689 RepID=UPI0040693ECD